MNNIAVIRAIKNSNDNLKRQSQMANALASKKKKKNSKFHTLVAVDIIQVLIGSKINFHFSVLYSETFRTSKMEVFAEIANGL